MAGEHGGKPLLKPTGDTEGDQLVWHIGGGLLLGFVLVMFERGARALRSRFPFLALCVVGAGILTALAVETHVTATWVTLRNLMLLFVLAAAVRALRTAPRSA